MSLQRKCHVTCRVKHLDARSKRTPVIVRVNMEDGYLIRSNALDLRLHT
jgi:hypothetical protein